MSSHGGPVAREPTGSRHEGVAEVASVVLSELGGGLFIDPPAPGGQNSLEVAGFTAGEETRHVDSRALG